MGKKKLHQVILVASAVIIGVVNLFPVYIMLLASVKPSQEIFNLKVLPDFNTITIDNYISVLKTENFGLYIYNSFFVSVIVTIAALVFHSMSGYALARLNFKGKKIIFTWMLSTLMIPFAVIMIPLFIIVRELQMTDSLWGIIIPMIPNAYGIFLFRQFYLGIPKELEESAKIDGASYFTIYRQIISPLSKPIATTLAVTFFLTNWNRYLWPLIVNQKKEFWVIQVAIANFRDDKEVAWNLILAASCIAVLPTLILFCFFQRYLVDGIKMLGIKG